MRQLPPVQRSESAPAPVDEGASIVEMLQRLSVSQWVVLLYPLFRALAERLRPRPEAGKEELLGLREEVVQELQQMRREVAELGERMDFTERLLAKQREADRLAPPRS